MPAHWWNALFQQRPTAPGGNLAKTIWFPIIHALPIGEMRRCRFWDIGGDEKKKGSDPDWTVGAKLARHPDGRIIIEDIIRVQKTSGDVQKLIVQTALMDGHEVVIREEQEGGSVVVIVKPGDVFGRLPVTAVSREGIRTNGRCPRRSSKAASRPD